MSRSLRQLKRGNQHNTKTACPLLAFLTSPSQREVSGTPNTLGQCAGKTALTVYEAAMGQFDRRFELPVPVAASLESAREAPIDWSADWSTNQTLSRRSRDCGEKLFAIHAPFFDVSTIKAGGLRLSPTSFTAPSSYSKSRSDALQLFRLSVLYLLAKFMPPTGADNRRQSRLQDRCRRGIDCPQSSALRRTFRASEYQRLRFPGIRLSIKGTDATEP